MGIGSNLLGLATGGLAGNENYGIADNIVGGVEDYFMGDTRAAREQQSAARNAEGYVQEYGDMALGGLGGLADQGAIDQATYRDNMASGAYGVDPSGFQTGGYQQGNFGAGPNYHNFYQGQAPQFSQYQASQAPQFGEFSRQQGPQFQRADAGNFDFNYESSPGYEFARDQGIKAIEGRASAQGRRLAGGTDKEIAEYASGLAAQDYGNQYNRARGSFEADRGFGAGQAGLENQFNQNQYQFGQSLDAQQQNLANQFGQNQYQFGANLGANQSNLANQFGQNAYQFNQNLGFQDNQAMNQLAANNYWNAAGMNQAENQFGANYNQGANLQNYNMLNQQAQQQAGLEGGLANQGYQSQVNLANAQIGQGDSLANAALGVGNANANRALATQNTVNNALNTGSQLVNAGVSLASL